MRNHMKWWGWGAEDKRFDIKDRPYLWPHVTNLVGLEQNTSILTPSLPLEAITLPKPKLDQPFVEKLLGFLKQDQLQLDSYSRLIHSYGKSFRDLWRIRNGIIKIAPDCVCFPESEDEVMLIVQLANEHQVVIIPFGGGSNIAGSLEPLNNDRMTVSLDMRRMEKVLEIDKQSMIARIQAGILGPELEAHLNQAGMTLGHLPDSFEWSSLGGWVATRSAGMKSDKYGKIEDMIIALKLITPSGKIVTRTIPKSSNGIDIRHICTGSEGILGVITEVTMQIHPLPKKSAVYGYLFPSFSNGINALYDCVKQDCLPAMTRLNDPTKTALSFAFKPKCTTTSHYLTKIIKFYLSIIKKFNMNETCLLLVGFEGDDDAFNRQRKKVHSIYKKWGAFSLGQKPGRSFEKGKYDFPYLRDFVMDYGITADVSETSTTWSNLTNLYLKTSEAITHAISQTGVKGACGCHISHTYRTGASLYFTFAYLQTNDVLAQYQKVKNAAQTSFIQNGGTLSHHHAVGYEHLPWIQEEISETGIKAIQGLKSKLDPHGIMNPGKIIPC